ncbi:MAG TPA: CRTAC1 family protein [Opitutaceae bacterium]
MKPLALTLGVRIFSAAACLPFGGVTPASGRELQAFPFTERSGSERQMKFTEIPGQQSGLVVANPYDDPMMWGSLYTEFQGGAIGTGIAVGDIDADGLVDIYIVNKALPNRLFRQVAPFRFEDVTRNAGVPGGATWSTGASFAGVDNDGDADLLLTAGSVEADKGSALHKDKLYLNDGRGQLSVTQLASGIFRNDGTGHFTFETLPRLAQAAPVFGIAAADFNEDGAVDLFLAQNFRGPQIKTDRFDGGIGQVLRGDGSGGFVVAPATESGVSIPGEGRGVALGDLDEDGRPDLLLTIVNENAKLLASRVQATGRSFCVGLLGSAGNPHAVGARVTVTFSSGATQASEILAGSGYLSQSEPLAFFSSSSEDEPRVISVNWPNGKQTSHPFLPGVSRMVLDHDS